ncbi:MAG: hypothetical protein SFX73_38620 [Kofleriaceae bacterium]|nr:hypothetical protein [Kofleriaceae bacterium]
MTSKVFVFALVAALAACSGKQGAPPTTGSNGSSSAVTPPAGGCEAVRGKIEGLYRTEAQAKEPQRVDEAVVDNTRMVMLECAKAPAQVSACIANAATLKDVESTCLPALDDEGTETDVLRK